MGDFTHGAGRTYPFSLGDYSEFPGILRGLDYGREPLSVVKVHNLGH